MIQCMLRCLAYSFVLQPHSHNSKIIIISIVTHGYWLNTHPSGVAMEDPVSPSHRHSEFSVLSQNANHSTLCTNPHNSFYCPTDADYKDTSDDSSFYCGDKPIKSSNPAFVVQDYTGPERTKCSYWYHTKLDAQPPPGLVHLHVATYY